MKRRGFLGFIGGAAVAGPQVAKNAIKTLPPAMNLGGGPMGIPSFSSSGAKDTCGPASNGDWRLEEIARLKRLISGELSQDEIEEKKQQRLYAMEPIVTQNIMALQSVSAARKVAMFGDRMIEVREEIDRFYHRRNLRQYLKEISG